MLAALTVYRNRVREWIQDAVAGNNRDGSTATAAAAATDAATAADRRMDREKTAAALTAAAAVPVAAAIAVASPSDERHQQPRQQDAAATATVGMPLSSQPQQAQDEEYIAGTVLSSMPEDMPLPPLAYTRRRSSSKTHTRLYRIRLPPKPRRAKR